MNKRLKTLGLVVFCYWQTSQGGLDEELLLAHRADVGAKERWNETPLYIAAA